MTPNAKPEDDFPWWLVILALTGAFLFVQIATSDIYSAALSALSKGIWITIGVAMVAYMGACLIGLALAVMMLSRHLVLRQIARLYIEVMRGVPIIVLLLYVAFAATPALVWAWNATGLPEVKARDVSLLWRAVIALTIAYSAFLAEVFRAGLASVDKGQIEAAQALGLTGWLRFRLVVFPQAFRTILPPLANDFQGVVL